MNVVDICVQKSPEKSIYMKMCYTMLPCRQAVPAKKK